MTLCCLLPSPVEGTDNTPFKLSVYTLFYDEYEYLHQWIECVSTFADEVLVVYTGSPNLYTSIENHIRGYNVNNIYSVPYIQDCSKYSKEWKQSDIRNYALGKTRNDWTLQLDIDETINGVALKDQIGNRLRDFPELNGFALPTLNLWTNGKVRVDGRWFPDWHWRVMNKKVSYTKGARHITIAELPEVRKIRTTTSILPYMLGRIDCSIVHHKYLKPPVVINSMIRCVDKDVNEFDYYRGLKTASMEDIHLVMDKEVV